MTHVEVTDEQIKAAQGGDSAAMWEVVEALDPMLKGLIRAAAPAASREDAEDLLQEARAVVVQYVRDYNSSASSAKLSSFLYQVVRRRIREEHVRSTTALTIDATTALEVRRALWEADGDHEAAWKAVEGGGRRGRMTRERFTAIVDALAGTERLDAPVGGDTDGDTLTLSDVVADPFADLTTSLERQDYARWLMTQISARQSYALRAYHGVGMTAIPDAEAAEEMGVTRNNLRQLRNAGCESARRVARVGGWMRGGTTVSAAQAA